jgi:lipase chaperone LimK
MRQGWWFGASLGLLGILLMLYWTATPEQPLGMDPPLTTAASPASVGPPEATSPHQTTAPTRHFVTGLEQLPASLQGTDVDGEIIIDGNRQLVVTRRLRDVFDYFLTTIGEEPLATVLARIQAYIRHRVPDPAQGQAIHLLNQYVSYRDALKNIPEVGGLSADQLDPDAVARQKQQEQQLRRQFFTAAEIDAFFADEDAYDQYSLAAIKIHRNSSLSEAQKAEQLAALINQLPANLQDSMQATSQYQQLDTLTTAIRARGGSDEDIRQMRLNLVGADATARLESIDREHASLDTRVSQYLQQKNQIMGQANLSPEQKALQIEQIEQRNFDAQERLRLAALEQLAKQQQG